MTGAECRPGLARRTAMKELHSKLEGDSGKTDADDISKYPFVPQAEGKAGDDPVYAG